LRAHLSARPTLSIPERDAFQLHLTPLNSIPTSLRMERPRQLRAGDDGGGGGGDGFAAGGSGGGAGAV